MTDLKRAELAIRRAASQMRGDLSRAFRLVADEMRDVDHMVGVKLDKIRAEQKELD